MWDCKLKPGQTHSFEFGDDDPPPFYDLDAPKEDTETAKRKRNGDKVIKQGYVGKAKGARSPPYASAAHTS